MGLFGRKPQPAPQPAPDYTLQVRAYYRQPAWYEEAKERTATRQLDEQATASRGKSQRDTGKR